jgi:hypothetical protein
MPEPFRGDREALRGWCLREYNDAVVSRRGYVSQLDEYDRQYEGKPLVARKTFPWDDASNLEVPVAGTHTDTVVARLEDAYFTTMPAVIVRPQSAPWEEHADALQDYLNLISLPQARFRREKTIDLLQTAKLGTSFLWLGYHSESKIVRRRGGNGRLVKRSQVIHEGPLYRAMHPRHVIFPPETRDVQDARWIAVRSYLTWGQLLHNQQSGMYDRGAVYNIEAKGTNVVTREEQRRERRQGVTRTGTIQQWEIVDLYAHYHDGDSTDIEDVWVTFHYPSGEILRAIYNPYDHLMRPLGHSVYMFREDAMLGLGVVGMVSMIQREITTIHNYGLDNALVSNTVIVRAKRNALKRLDAHPMAVVTVDGNVDDVRFEQMGRPSPGLSMLEAQANLYAERRTGIGESNFPSAGSAQGLAGVRTPAHTAMAMLGESNRRFMLAISLSKESDKQLLLQHLLLLRQYWSTLREAAFTWDPKRAMLLDQLLREPIDALRHSLHVDTSVSTASLNEEVERQKMMVLAEFMKGYYEMFLQLIATLRQVPALAREVKVVLKGASEFALRVMRTFDVRDAERFIPDIDEQASEPAVNTDARVNQFVGNLLAGGVGGGAGGPGNGARGGATGGEGSVPGGQARG